MDPGPRYRAWIDAVWDKRPANMNMLMFKACNQSNRPGGCFCGWCRDASKGRAIYMDYYKIHFLDLWKIFPGLSLRDRRCKWTKYSVRVPIPWPDKQNAMAICQWIGRVALYYSIAKREEHKLKSFSIIRFWRFILCHPLCPLDALFQVYTTPNEKARAWFWEQRLSLIRISDMSPPAVNVAGQAGIFAPTPELLERAVESHREREAIPVPCEDVMTTIASFLSIKELGRFNLARKTDPSLQRHRVRCNLLQQLPETPRVVADLLTSQPDMYDATRRYMGYFITAKPNYSDVRLEFAVGEAAGGSRSWYRRHFDRPVLEVHLCTTRDVEDPHSIPLPTSEWLAQHICRRETHGLMSRVKYRHQLTINPT